MEWSKSTISKAELERKQREYMEAAMNMAKKAGGTSQTAEHESDTAVKAEIVEEIVEEIDDLTETIEEIRESSETTSAQTEMFEEITEEKNEQFGVFNAEELVSAIEKGEVSNEGLKQAAEILEEMTRKTETMRKLVEEQENEEEDCENGGDYGLNSFINRHNSNCRGCKNESGGTYTP